jgi:single-stranded-DNA-specific exonuclease
MRKIAAGMQKKVWQVRPASRDAAALAQSLKVSPLMAQVLINRKLDQTEGARAFLSPKLTDLIEPERMYGIPAAVECIRQAIEGRKNLHLWRLRRGRHHQRGYPVASPADAGHAG